MDTSTDTRDAPPQRSDERAGARLPETGFVRESRLLEFVPFSHSTLWRRVAARTFPEPVKLSERVTAWRVEDVHDWIRAQGSGKATPAA